MSAFFRARRDDILARWQRSARRSAPAEGLSEPALRDHLPAVLDELLEFLQKSPGDDEEQSAEVQIHALDRLRRRFPVESLVREYRSLRETLWTLWREAGGSVPAASACWARTDRILDDFIVRSVERHSREEAQYREELERIAGIIADRSPEAHLDILARQALAAIESAVCVTFYRAGGSSIEVVARAPFAAAWTADQARLRQVLQAAEPQHFDDGRILVLPLRLSQEIVGLAELVTREPVVAHDRLLFQLFANRATASLFAGRSAGRVRSLAERVSELIGELDAIYAHAPVGLAHLDDEGRLKRSNQGFAEITGVPANQHVGKRLCEAFPAFAASEHLIRDVLANRQATSNGCLARTGSC